MGKWGEWPLPQSHTTQSLTPSKSAQTSTPRPRQLTPQQGESSTGWGERESREWDYCFSPGWCHRIGVLHPRKMAFAEWKNDSAQVSRKLSLQLSPQSHKPQTLLMWLLSALSTLCQTQCEWPCMKFCVGILRGCLCLWWSPISPWMTETSLLFTTRCYRGASYLVWCCGLGNPAWGLDPTFLKGNTPTTEIFLRNLSLCLWERSQPFSPTLDVSSL